MPDPYRETEIKNNPSPENLESNPEAASEILPEVAVEIESEISSVSPAPEAETQKSAPFDFSREGDVTEDELAALKIFADLVATKGVDAANEAAREYSRKNNFNHFMDLWHDFLTNEENQSRLGIKQL